MNGASSPMPPHRVILNEVKDLDTYAWCIQILRVAQDDTFGGVLLPPRPFNLSLR